MCPALYSTGADPGFWERVCVINIVKTGGGTGGGATARGFWGSADSSPSGPSRFFAFAFI